MNKEKNLKMFGVDNIRQWADMAMDASEGDAMGMIRSMLSDVQEMIERDMKEEARLQINRVKYLLSEVPAQRSWRRAFTMTKLGTFI